MEEIVERLERLEAELEKVKERQRAGEVRGTNDDIVNILKEAYKDHERVLAFIYLERRVADDGSKYWDEWACMGPVRATDEINLHKLSKLMESCSSEARLKILHEVFKSPKYPRELSEATGLTGGALYHHLEILTEAGLIERDKLGRIVRTPEGELFTAVVLKLIGEIAEEAYPKGEVEGAVGEEAH